MIKYCQIVPELTQSNYKLWSLCNLFQTCLIQENCLQKYKHIGVNAALHWNAPCRRYSWLWVEREKLQIRSFDYLPTLMLLSNYDIWVTSCNLSSVQINVSCLRLVKARLLGLGKEQPGPGSLQHWRWPSFSAPLPIVNIIPGLLCSNHWPWTRQHLQWSHTAALQTCELQHTHETLLWLKLVNHYDGDRRAGRQLWSWGAVRGGLSLSRLGSGQSRPGLQVR